MNTIKKTLSFSFPSNRNLWSSIGRMLIKWSLIRGGPGKFEFGCHDPDSKGLREFLMINEYTNNYPKHIESKGFPEHLIK